MREMQRYIVVDDLFTRYTIVVDIADRTTSVYCDECSEWVVEYEGEQLSRHTHLDLYELIIEEHSPIGGTRVEF